jgi:DNA gyrase subunit A
MKSSAGRYLLFNSGAIASKAAKDSQGVAVMTLKKGHRVDEVTDLREGQFAKPSRYRTKNLPSAGAILSAEDQGEQLTF